MKNSKIYSNYIYYVTKNNMNTLINSFKESLIQLKNFQEFKHKTCRQIIFIFRALQIFNIQIAECITFDVILNLRFFLFAFMKLNL